MGFFGALFKKKRHPLGGMLTASAIDSAVRNGLITISDYNPKRLNPNSYNLAIGNEVVMYKNVGVIDLKDPETYSSITRIPIDAEEGLILRPGNLYLINTAEEVGTDLFIPMLAGRSSMGRLGIAVHQSAGFGDIGYSGKFTLQIRVTYPTKIYPGLMMSQIYFLTPAGEIGSRYTGHYRNVSTPESRFRG